MTDATGHIEPTIVADKVSGTGQEAYALIPFPHEPCHCEKKT